MNFISFRDGRKEALEGKPFDPYKEEIIGKDATGSLIVKKTYDPIYDLAYQRGQDARARYEAMKALNDRPLYITTKPTCPHCGKEL